MNAFRLLFSYFKDQAVLRPLIVSLLLLLVTFAITIYYTSVSQPLLPLLYTYTQSEQILVDKWWLLLLPSFSLVSSFINQLLQFALRNIDSLVLTIFSWFTIFIQCVLLLALIRIIVITA